METEPTAIARRAASRLAGVLEPGLPVALERALLERGPEVPLRSYDAGTGIALASFLLSAVQFGWTIWRDLKKDREEARERTERALAAPPRDLLLRRLRLGVDPPRGLLPAHRDQILEAVAEEILEAEDAGP